MKKKQTYEDRLRDFEREKKMLLSQGLSFLEYEKAVRELAYKYKV